MAANSQSRVARIIVCVKTCFNVNNLILNSVNIFIFHDKCIFFLWQKLKPTVLAPWTRHPETTVAKMEAIRMITPNMKIPGEWQMANENVYNIQYSIIMINIIQLLTLKKSFHTHSE